ncbi:MAG TPA: hypothetical protein VG755_11530, partial [Nannocystaceae bacterium]|nr:hypothetical protein [Nannocystaceae bacterium]
MSKRPAFCEFVVVALAMTGCAFDSQGYGPHHGSVAEDSSSDGAAADDDDAAPDDGGNEVGGDTRTSADDRSDDGGAATSDASDAGEAGSDPATDDGSAVDAGADDDDAGTSGAVESESGGIEEPTCPAEVLTLLWSEGADVGAPMQLVPTDANMDPDVAASAVAESGTITFAIDFACPGEYSLWGLVWDYSPGAYGSDDPDSFYVGIGGPESTWRYGCQTAEMSSGLSWQPLQALQTQPCDAAPL